MQWKWKDHFASYVLCGFGGARLEAAATTWGRDVGGTNAGGAIGIREGTLEGESSSAAGVTREGVTHKETEIQSDAVNERSWQSLIGHRDKQQFIISGEQNLRCAHEIILCYWYYWSH